MKNKLKVTNYLRFCFSILFVINAAFPSAYASEPDPLAVEFKPYTAHYVLRKAGMTIASLRQQLSVQNAQLEFSTYTKPKGIAALISRKPVTENSVINVGGDRVRPELYSRRYTGEKDAKIKDMDIDYKKDAGKAFVTVADEKYEFDNNDDLLDERSVLIATMFDLKPEKSELNYRVIDENEIKNYHYSVEKKELLDTVIGEKQSIKIIRKHGSRETHMWFAPELNNLLLKVKSFRKGKLKSELLIKSVTGELLEP